MDGGAWWAAVHVVAKSRTRLSDFPFPFPFPFNKLLLLPLTYSQFNSSHSFFYLKTYTLSEVKRF